MEKHFSNSSQKYIDLTDENILPIQQSNSKSISVSSEQPNINFMIDIIKDTISCFTDYLKCKENEITERKRIAANLQAIEYRIDAQKEIYLEELKMSFAERNKIYDIAKKLLTKH